MDIKELESALLKMPTRNLKNLAEYMKTHDRFIYDFVSDGLCCIQGAMLNKWKRPTYTKADHKTLDLLMDTKIESGELLSNVCNRFLLENNRTGRTFEAVKQMVINILKTR